MQAAEPISAFETIGVDVERNTSRGTTDGPELLLINTDRGLVDESQARGINSNSFSSSSAVAGDFDNDMDVDIYLVGTHPATNQPNLYYENQGDGTFLSLPDGGGAAGSLQGLGDVAIAADYDLDGFLDLLVTNGAYPPPLNEDGPAQLFHNQGNGNRWLQIDLQGTTSNRDGIGARVIATAGGKAQLRERGSETHRYAQNFSRLHFGLGENRIVDELLIQWPSGLEQRLTNIGANQIIEILEPSGPFVAGAPDIEVGQDAGIFLWQETFDGPYFLRHLGTAEGTDLRLIWWQRRRSQR
ncbi:MAG: CRTAC1 family protein [Chloroflexaceae bacterium]|nr:CRTAC1 family protein [Chloroflexaceae bacterium]